MVLDFAGCMLICLLEAVHNHISRHASSRCASMHLLILFVGNNYVSGTSSRCDVDTQCTSITIALITYSCPLASLSRSCCQLYTVISVGLHNMCMCLCVSRATLDRTATIMDEQMHAQTMNMSVNLPCVRAPLGLHWTAPVHSVRTGGHAILPV